MLTLAGEISSRSHAPAWECRRTAPAVRATGAFAEAPSPRRGVVACRPSKLYAPDLECAPDWAVLPGRRRCAAHTIAMRGRPMREIRALMRRSDVKDH